MRPGLAKIIEKVRIWCNFDSPETDLYLAANGRCIDYTDTWPSKRVHWMSICRSTNCSTVNYGYEDMLELDTRVAWASLRITRIHPHVAEASITQWILATPHNTGQMDHHRVRHWGLMAFPILHPVDVEMAYGYSASCFHCVQWHVRSYWLRCVSIAKKKTERKEDLYFAVTFQRQKLSRYHGEVTPMTSILLVSAHILNLFRKLRSVKKWVTGMDIHPEDKTS